MIDVGRDWVLTSRHEELRKIFDKEWAPKGWYLTEEAEQKICETDSIWNADHELTGAGSAEMYLLKSASELSTELRKRDKQLTEANARIKNSYITNLSPEEQAVVLELIKIAPQTQAKVTELETKLKSAEEELHGTKGEVDGLTAQKETKTQELEQVRLQHAELAADIEQLTQNKTTLEEKCVELSVKKNASVGTLAETEAKLAPLRQEQANLDTYVADKTKEKTLLDSAVHNLEESKSKLMQSIIKLKDEQKALAENVAEQEKLAAEPAAEAPAEAPEEAAEAQKEEPVADLAELTALKEKLSQVETQLADAQAKSAEKDGELADAKEVQDMLRETIDLYSGLIMFEKEIASLSDADKVVRLESKIAEQKPACITRLDMADYAAARTFVSGWLKEQLKQAKLTKSDIPLLNKLEQIQKYFRDKFDALKMASKENFFEAVFTEVDKIYSLAQTADGILRERQEAMDESEAKIVELQEKLAQLENAKKVMGENETVPDDTGGEDPNVIKFDLYEDEKVRELISELDNLALRVGYDFDKPARPAVKETKQGRFARVWNFVRRKKDEPVSFVGQERSLDDYIAFVNKLLFTYNQKQPVVEVEKPVDDTCAEENARLRDKIAGYVPALEAYQAVIESLVTQVVSPDALNEYKALDSYETRQQWIKDNVSGLVSQEDYQTALNKLKWAEKDIGMLEERLADG